MQRCREMASTRKNYLGLGIALGGFLGIARGAAMHRVGVGLVFGMAFGIALGSLLDRRGTKTD
jgi:hypothetical protein